MSLVVICCRAGGQRRLSVARRRLGHLRRVLLRLPAGRRLRGVPLSTPQGLPPGPLRRPHPRRRGEQPPWHLQCFVGTAHVPWPVLLAVPFEAASSIFLLQRCTIARCLGLEIKQVPPLLMCSHGSRPLRGCGTSPLGACSPGPGSRRRSGLRRTTRGSCASSRATACCSRTTRVSQ